MFIHLKKGLDSEPVDWLGCDEPPEECKATFILKVQHNGPLVTVDGVENG